MGALGLFQSGEAKSKKSEIGEFRPYVPEVDMEQFGGDSELIESVADYIVYLQDPKKFREEGGKLQRHFY